MHECVNLTVSQERKSNSSSSLNEGLIVEIYLFPSLLLSHLVPPKIDDVPHLENLSASDSEDSSLEVAHDGIVSNAHLHESTSKTKL